MNTSIVPRVYVCGTRRGAGKTTFSLGLFKAIRDQIKNMGYIKPVSAIGRDPYTFQSYFGLENKIIDINPIKITSGITRRYIMTEDSEREQLKASYREAITLAFSTVARGKEFMLIEGTGHAGVAYCLDLSNALVSWLLKAPAILMVEAGIGNSIDSSAQYLEYFKTLFKKKGAEASILGVVINRVDPNKVSYIAPPLTKAFGRLGIDVLGFLPFDKNLSLATVREVGKSFLTAKISELTFYGSDEQLQNTLTRPIIGAMSIKSIQSELSSDGILLIIPSYRKRFLEKIIALIEKGKLKTISALIIAGKSRYANHFLSVTNELPVPVWHINSDNFSLAEIQEIARRVIYSETKIDGKDTNKIEKAYNLVIEHININGIISATSAFAQRP